MEMADGKGMWYEWMKWKFSEHLRIPNSKVPKYYWLVLNRIRYTSTF